MKIGSPLARDFARHYERSARGKHPQQNGRHERMHLTLKKEATKPACRNFLQQQARFDKFIEVFNNERPHEALNMKCPAEVYQPSPRPYTGLLERREWQPNCQRAIQLPTHHLPRKGV
jgi:transposase InsO family protein